MTTVEMPYEVQKLMNKLWTDIVGREPRYIYWECDGYMFCWTTEKDRSGKYYAFTYRPYGKGARTNPTRWKLTQKTAFAKRRIAKARAYDRLVKFSNRNTEKAG